MNSLFEISDTLIDRVDTGYIRGFVEKIDWDSRLIGLKGSRGVGKTTLLLQYIKSNKLANALYISMDDLYFSDNKLVVLAEQFSKIGGRYLFVDEVHLYRNWSVELKLIYDRYPDLQVVFTGSSMISLEKAQGDLSRRAVIYTLQGLSFREYLNFFEETDFKAYEFVDILHNHREIAREIRTRLKPLAFFQKYMTLGYYPYVLESESLYLEKLKNTINVVIEIDIPKVVPIERSKMEKLRQLLHILATSVPFVPNISKLSERIGLDRNTLKQYLHYLSEAGIISNLFSNSKGISLLTKPEKIYLHHPNLLYALAKENANIGNSRESFFLNQLSYENTVNYSKQTDFFVNGKYSFEIGGKSKTKQQIAGLQDAFVVKDDIEIGFGNEIPLWLFGFLY